MRALALMFWLTSCGSSAEPHAVTVPTPSSRDAFTLIESSRDLDGNPVGPSTAKATIAFVFASWCVNCRNELPALDGVRADDVRILGINYKQHEEYADRGSAEAVRAFSNEEAPWLRIVPVGDDVFTALGSPSTIPTIYVFDRSGARVATFDRSQRRPPSSDELAAILAKL